MSRIVRAPVSPRRRSVIGLEVNAGTDPAGSGDDSTPDDNNAKEGDGYLQRVAKYIPAEILGFFLFVNNILQEAGKPVTDAAGKTVQAVMAGGKISVHTVALLVFLLAWFLTPLYIWAMRDGTKDEAWRLNAAVAALAFPVWAYAMNAVIFANIHDGHLASIFLATFTVCSGLIKPEPRADEPDPPPPPPAPTPPAPTPPAPPVDPTPTPSPPAPAPVDPPLPNDVPDGSAYPPRN